MNLKIEYIPIHQIKPYENNAKIHTPEQIEQIKTSISEFGMNDPIAIWSEENLIIEGHGRLMACQELGFETIPVIRLDGLTDEQRRAYTLIHNQTTMSTGFDLEILEAELREIQDIDMAAFDFDIDFEALDVPDLDEIGEEDDYELELPEEPKAKLGDVYQLGRHRLMCGDCTKTEDIDELCDGAIMDLCVTDPPYNVDYTGGGESKLKIQNDNMDDAAFHIFLKAYYEQMLRVLKAGGAFYVWHAETKGSAFRSALHEAGGQVKQVLVWVKNALVLGRQDYQWKHEPCLYGWKEGAGHYFTDDRKQTTVFEDQIDIEKLDKNEMRDLLRQLMTETTPTTVIHEDKPLKNDIHPTMKPVKLISILVGNSSRPNENVIDFFGGSGSTLMACEQLKRNCYIIELDPRYVDAIINRWEQLTGEKAIKVNERKNNE